MVQGCNTEKNTGLMYDPRFSKSGIYTDLFDVELNNGVFAILVS